MISGTSFSKKQIQERMPDVVPLSIPYTPHGGQFLFHHSPQRFKVVVCGRKWGKTTMLIWEAFQWIGVPGALVWWVAPQHSLSTIAWKRILREWSPLTIKVTDRLTIPLIRKVLVKDRIIEFQNGSRMEFKTAENPKSLLGEGVDFMIIDETSRVRKEVWESDLRPNLSDSSHAGYACMASCVTADTLVVTDPYISQIVDLKPDDQPDCIYSIRDHEIKLLGFGDEYDKTSQYICSGYTDTIKIKTDYGFELEGTHDHPIWGIIDNKESWIQLKDIKMGDWVAIRRGWNKFGDGVNLSEFKPSTFKILKKFNTPEKVDDDLAYLMGLIISDGHVDFKKGRRRVTITNIDEDVIKFLENNKHLKFKPYDNIHYSVSSKQLINLLEYIGFKSMKAPHKTIPDMMFNAEKHVMSSLLRGLFDGDGSSSDKRIAYYSTSEKLINQIRMILLNYGIVSSKRFNITKPTKRVKVESKLYSLEIYGDDAIKFYNEIGFNIKRKQLEKNNSQKPNGKDRIPHALTVLREHLKVNVRHKDEYIKYGKSETIGYDKLKEIIEYYCIDDDKLNTIIDNNYLWVKVKNIQNGYAKTYDVHIPETHAFISNGFISHNTPQGLNWYYDEWMKGLRGFKRHYDPEYESWYVPFRNMPITGERIHQYYPGGFPTWTNPHWTDMASAVRQAKRAQPTFLQEIAGRFLEDVSFVFKGTGKVIEKGGKYQEARPSGKYFIGADIARTNDYFCAIVVNSDLEVCNMLRYRGRSFRFQVNDLISMAEDYNDARILVDSTGMGEPVYEMIREHYKRVDAMSLTNESKQRIVDNLALTIATKKHSIPEEAGILIEELRNYGSEKTSSGKVRYKAPGNGHDDTVIADSLACWIAMGMGKRKTIGFRFINW